LLDTYVTSPNRLIDDVVFKPQLDEDLKALPISPSKALADGIFDALAERICFSSSRFHDVFDITGNTI
jgi:hypothetical protein